MVDWDGFGNPNILLFKNCIFFELGDIERDSYQIGWNTSGCPFVRGFEQKKSAALRDLGVMLNTFLGDLKNVGQTVKEVVGVDGGRPTGSPVRREPLGLGEEGAPEAQGDLQGPGEALATASASIAFRKMKLIANLCRFQLNRFGKRQS